MLLRVKLSTAAACELIAIVILVPLCISFWFSGWRHMKYYQQYEKALMSYNSGQSAEVLVALEKAEKNRITVSLYTMKGNVLVEQGKYAEALRIYEELAEFTTDNKIPQLGIAVCKMYLLAEKKDSERSSALYQLEKEIREITRDNPEFSDAAVLLGNIYLQQALEFRKSGKQDRVNSSLDLALKEFNRAENPQPENWLPPSRNACFSLYVGKAYTLCEKSAELLNSLVQPALPSPETNTICAHLYEAVQCLRKAFYLRVQNRELVSNCMALYGNLLSLPWLDSQTEGRLGRKALLEEAHQHINSIEHFKTHIHWSRESSEYLAKWQLDNKSYTEIMAPMYYGLGMSYFAIGDESKGVNNIESIVADFWKSIPVVEETYLEMYTHLFAKAYLANKKERPDSQFVCSEGCTGFWNRQFKKMEELKQKVDNKPSLPQLISLNNWLVMNFWQKEKPAPLIELANYVQNFANKVPATKILVGAQQDPVSAMHVLRHNLFMIYRTLPSPYKENASQFASYRLTFGK